MKINDIYGRTIFEAEAETYKGLLEKAVKERADLTGANLTGADLRGADLRGADLTPIKEDYFKILSVAIPEIPRLKLAIKEGRINGSTYEGECACLCGTLEKGDKEIARTVFDLRDSSRPIERFFLGIKKGDTPETNPISRIVLE